MNKFNCKDFYIIKIRIYASEYLLNKAHKNGENLPVQHRQRVGQYHDFLHEFFEHFTGIKMHDWILNHFGDHTDCAYEELQEKFGILQSDAESHKIFLIPKDREDILEWIKENVKLPYKIISRIRVPFKFYADNYGLGNKRQLSEEWTKKNVHSKFKNEI